MLGGYPAATGHAVGGARLKELSNRRHGPRPGEGRAGRRRQWRGDRKSEEHERALPASDTHCPCSVLGTSGCSTEGPSPQLAPPKGERESVSRGLALRGPSIAAACLPLMASASQMPAEDTAVRKQTQLCVGVQDRRDVDSGVELSLGADRVTDRVALRPPPTGYQIAYRLASSSPNTFTTVEVGATVRQFTATELAPESAYTFRLSAKTRQGWGEPLEATVITTEKRGKTLRPKFTVTDSRGRIDELE